MTTRFCYRSGTASILLITTTRPLPSVTTRYAIAASCLVTPICASTTSSTTFDLPSARRAYDTERASSGVVMSHTPQRLMPAVSTSLTVLPSYSHSTSVASRVRPGVGPARTRSVPSSVFVRVLLPTLGRPTMHTWTGRSSASAAVSASETSA